MRTKSKEIRQQHGGDLIGHSYFPVTGRNALPLQLLSVGLSRSV
jgi:hypothetical protein